MLLLQPESKFEVKNKVTPLEEEFDNLYSLSGVVGDINTLLVPRLTMRKLSALLTELEQRREGTYTP